MVGKGRFELPTSRSRTVHSNLAELLPERPGMIPPAPPQPRSARPAPQARPHSARSTHVDWYVPVHPRARPPARRPQADAAKRTAPPPMATTTPRPAPSFALTDDQVQLRDWLHDFAAKVVRPAAEEWDEREETPWPIIQEAAKIGLYSFEFLHTSFGDETGLTMPIVNEELFWGDAGIGLSIFGTHLASAAIFANGTPEQMLEWIPRCFGTPDDVKLGAFAITEPDAGSDVASLRTRARKDGDDWILNGTKCFITNGGIADVHVVVATVDPNLGHG